MPLHMACSSDGGGGCGGLKSEKQNEQQKEATSHNAKKEKATGHKTTGHKANGQKATCPEANGQKATGQNEAQRQLPHRASPMVCLHRQTEKTMLLCRMAHLDRLDRLQRFHRLCWLCRDHQTGHRTVILRYHRQCCQWFHRRGGIHVHRLCLHRRAGLHRLTSNEQGARL